LYPDRQFVIDNADHGSYRHRERRIGDGMKAFRKNKFAQVGAARHQFLNPQFRLGRGRSRVARRRFNRFLTLGGSGRHGSRQIVVAFQGNRRYYSPFARERSEKTSDPPQSTMTPKEEAHIRILRAIEKYPDASQRGLARALGVSLGRVNFLLNALVDKGLVKVAAFRKSGDKLNKIVYLLTPEGVADRVRLTSSYLARKEAEYVALKAELKELRKENLDFGSDKGHQR